MTNFNFLSKSSSQSCSHSSVTLASTVGSPSAHCRGAMLKLISVLVLMLTFGIGQMWGATYNLYSGALTEGDYIIYYDGYAMKAGVTSDRFDNQTVSPSNNKITDPTNENLIVWHIAASGDYWTIYNTQNSGKYAASTGVKNKAQLLASCTGDNADYCLWSASGTSTYEFVNKKNNANKVNKNLRNNGTNGWACYSTQTGGALTLYKKAASNTPTITKSSSMTTLTYSNGSPVAQSFTIGGSNLTNTVTVTAPTDYEVCKTVDGTYESSISFTNTEVNAANKTVYIRLQSGLSAGEISSRNITIASEDATTQTIAVTGSVPYKIIWMANGSEHATTYVAIGSTLVLPATDPVPNTCGCTGKTFYGWYGGGTSYKNASVAPSIAAAGNTVNADKTYYAVFADEDESSQEANVYKLVSSISASKNYIFATSNSAGSVNGLTCTTNSSLSATSLTVKTNGDDKYIEVPASDNVIWKITNPESGKYNAENKGQSGKYLRCYGASPYAVIATSAYALYWSTTKGLYGKSTSGSTSYYLYYTGSAWNASSSTSSRVYPYEYGSITIESTTYTNFETTCCQPLASINGSFF